MVLQIYFPRNTRDGIASFRNIHSLPVQLDRQVTGREPLVVRTEGTLSNQSSLLVIGNPSGLPLKVAGGAGVRTNAHPFYFSANLDTFQGNSGSAVLNADSGVVEGILVRGEEDFEANTSLMCIEAKRCDDSGCRGEDVSRMTSIPEMAMIGPLFRLAEKGDVKELGKLLKTNFWIDIYGKDGRTALMKAVENNRPTFVSALIEKSADVKIQDANGDSALHVLAAKLNRKNANLLKILTAAGADREARNTAKETPVLVAARALNLEGVKLLIAQGAEKNAVNQNNENILFAFARKGDQKTVKELIALGVDATVKNAQGLTIEELKK